MLERENAFYRAHQAEFREKYLDKWLIIADGDLFGVYNTPKDAILAAQERFNDDEFILHRPVDDDMVLEVGPMGVVHLHRPYDNKPKLKPVITSTGGELITFDYAR
jgi:hypothetical protein